MFKYPKGGSLLNEVFANLKNYLKQNNVTK